MGFPPSFCHLPYYMVALQRFITFKLELLGACMNKKLQLFILTLFSHFTVKAVESVQFTSSIILNQLDKIITLTAKERIGLEDLKKLPLLIHTLQDRKAITAETADEFNALFFKYHTYLNEEGHKQAQELEKAFKLFQKDQNLPLILRWIPSNAQIEFRQKRKSFILNVIKPFVENLESYASELKDLYQQVDGPYKEIIQFVIDYNNAFKDIYTRTL